MKVSKKFMQLALIHYQKNANCFACLHFKVANFTPIGPFGIMSSRTASESEFL